MNEIMLPLWAQVAIAVLVLTGSFIALLGSLGLMRLKSYFERVHAPSIIATLGCWLIMWALVIFFSVSGHGFAAHPLLIAVFIAVTVPITTI
ncbi:MAG: monovalent cation/H(+) antiporter subunit G, partial [Comamonas sp.]